MPLYKYIDSADAYSYIAKYEQVLCYFSLKFFEVNFKWKKWIHGNFGTFFELSRQALQAQINTTRLRDSDHLLYTTSKLSNRVYLL